MTPSEAAGELPKTGTSPVPTVVGVGAAMVTGGALAIGLPAWWARRQRRGLIEEPPLDR